MTIPSSPTAQQPSYLVIGAILRPHGITGELRMKVLTSYPEHLSELDTVYLGKSPDSAKIEAYALEQVRMHQGYALLRLKGISSREDADRLRQLAVMVAFDDAVPLESGEFYLYQLIGLSVQTQDGRELGKITEVLETGANDVYIIQSAEHGEILLPATENTVLSTDLDSGVMMVVLPEGLI